MQQLILIPVKHLLLSLLFIGFCCAVDAQSFDKNTTYRNTLNVYAGSFVGDINQDGFDDIVCTDRRYIYVWLNNGTDSIGFTKYVAGEELSEEKIFKLWDVDNDGDLDILMGVPKKIVLIENQSTPSKPAFAMSNKDFLFLGVATQKLINFDIADVNDDSLYDIVVAYDKTEVFFQRENNTFFRFELKNAPFQQVRKVEIADLNQDGRKDILICGLDTTNHQGLLFLNNSNNNFSSSAVLNTNPVYNFFLNRKDTDHVDISAFSQEDDNLSLLTYNYLPTSDSVSFNIVKQTILDTGTKQIAFGQFNENDSQDLIYVSGSTDPIRLWNDFEQDTVINREILDSVGIVKSVFISDLDRDGDDDIIIFTDRNAFLIYEQIAKPVSVNDEKYHVSLFPNPVGDYLRLDTELPVESVYISDMYGRRIGVYDGKQMTSVWLDTSGLNPGIYAITPVINNKMIPGKLFVKM